MKHPIFAKTIAITFTSLALWLSCSDNSPTAQGGSGTDTGNAFIQGVLYNREGKPAANALVRFIRMDYDPSPLAKTLATVYAVTDDSGRYSLDTLADGDYNLFGEKDGDMSYRDSVPVRKDYKIRVPSDTLNAPGSLSGVVKLMAGHSSQTVFIIVMGTDHYFTTPIDSIGHFKIREIPGGDYRFKILTTIPNYNVLDTILTVRSGKDDTLSDTLRLNYSGVPVPQGLKVTYDTLNGVAHLTWNRIAGLNVAGFIVFRNDSSSQTPIRISGDRLVQDTAYDDMVFTTITDTVEKVYVYRLKAQNNNADQSASFSLSDTLFAIPRSKVRTFITLSPFGVVQDTASIKDTILIVGQYANANRPNIRLTWISDNTDTLKTLDCKNSLSGKDSLKLAFPAPGSHTIRIRITDNSGWVWESIYSFTVVLDAPVAKAIANDVVHPGDTILLISTGTDRFGHIVEWAWAIGKSGQFAIVDSGEYRVKSPMDTTSSYNCILRVKDDDGLYCFDTVYINVGVSGSYVFWYKGLTNLYSITDANPGPALPGKSTIKEGMIFSATIRESAGNQDPDFVIGSGLDDIQGRTGMFWVKDLMHAKGAVDTALLRAEFRDGWGGNAYCNAGPIHLRIGVVDFKNNVAAWGSENDIEESAIWMDESNPISGNMGYDANTKILQAEDTITIQAPAGRTGENGIFPLEGKFMEINVTHQVNWILAHTGNQKGVLSGQYAIAFLVKAGDGSIGKINTYSDETRSGSLATPNPWTKDGNTLHLYTKGILRFDE